MIASAAAIAMLLGQSSLVAAGHELDFWLGEWKVYVGGERAGKDVVEKSLNGFAVTEGWAGTEDGDVGAKLHAGRKALEAGVGHRCGRL